MEDVLERLFSQYDMMLMMVLLSLLIKIYKYFSLPSTKHSFGAFLSAVWKDLLSDVIVILAILLVDVYVINLHPSIMMIGIVLSDSIMNWFVMNQSKVTKNILNKLVDLLLEELGKNRKSKSKDNEEISDE